MNYSRQIKSIYEQCLAIKKENGVLYNGLFYDKLNSFIPFYDEVRNSMKSDYATANSMLKSKIEELPSLEFIDYADPFSIRNIVFTIVATIVFPVAILYLLRKYAYVKDIKSRLSEIERSISSIEMLARSLED